LELRRGVFGTRGIESLGLREHPALDFPVIFNELNKKIS